MQKLRAIIPAAGKGTRLQAVYGNLPKAMIPLNGRPMLEIVLDHVRFVEPKDTYIVVGHCKDAITDYFGEKYNYVDQKEMLGTGHAVMMCAEAFQDYNGSVLVTFGDMPLFPYDEMYKMCCQHELCGASCTLMTAENPSLVTWARILRDDQGAFKEIIEGKDCTPDQARIKELFAGVMVFNSKELFEMLPKVRCSNVQHEYYLTEVPKLMAKQGLKVVTFSTNDGENLQGVNLPTDVELCERILRERSK